MSLKLARVSEGRSVLSSLDHVSFVNDETGKYFIISNKKGDEIQVTYAPAYVSSWDHSRFELFLFENPYLNAENDVFEIHIEGLAARVGYIFPIATLDSIEHDYVNNRYFKNYSSVAYWKLLQSNFTVNLVSSKIEYSLSELFPDLCVALLSKDDLAQIPGFRIEDYSLSFLKSDYLLFQSSRKGKAAFNKTAEIQKLRSGTHRLTIQKSRFDILLNQYTKSLFIDHVYQSESFLVKYIMLYQIFEYFIEVIGDAQLENVINEYSAGRISKNKVKESIKYLNSDRSLLKNLFEHTPIDSEVRKSYMENCIYLANDIGEGIKSDFIETIYDFRNLITHRYRAVASKTDSTSKVVQLFELVVIEFLINYNSSSDLVTHESDVVIVPQKNTKPGLRQKLCKFICRKVCNCT